MNSKANGASYRPHGYGISPALKRARDPFRTRNAITGTLLVAFAVSVWAYSISAVKQDEFDDVDAEALRLDKGRLVSIEDQTNAALSPTSAPISAPTSAPTPATLPSQSRSPSNLLAQFKPTIIDRFAQLRHPQNGNVLVWGAPPLSRIGSIGDRRDAPW